MSMIQSSSAAPASRRRWSDGMAMLTLVTASTMRMSLRPYEARACARSSVAGEGIPNQLDHRHDISSRQDNACARKRAAQTRCEVQQTALLVEPRVQELDVVAYQRCLRGIALHRIIR